MIPKFKRPVSAFALCVLAVASWLAAGVILLDLWVSNGLENDATAFIYPGVLFAVGLLFLSLGRLIHHAAEASHYLKYICWENRIANQLAEKKKTERPIQPPSSAPDVSNLDPIERLFRSANQ